MFALPYELSEATPGESGCNNPVLACTHFAVVARVLTHPAAQTYCDTQHQSGCNESVLARTHSATVALWAR